MALIQHCTALVANDTALVHGFAMGTPTVALFGPTLLVRLNHVVRTAMCLNVRSSAVRARFTQQCMSCGTLECLTSIGGSLCCGA
jgi:ADP-heptose:LPS heptosyltransferase